MNPSDIIVLPARKTSLGDGLDIRRALPQSKLPRVGAWCFLDHFGPMALHENHPGMRVGPHPHIGLQTVTWLLAGDILHRDSLGYEQFIRPGQLNLMTSGKGITHSEESPPEHSPEMHGLQFWIALPDAVRNAEPAFDHYAELPSGSQDGMDYIVFVGSAFGVTSPAKVHSPLVGADIALVDAGTRELPLAREFEHAVMVVEGKVTVAGHSLEPGAIVYLPTGRHSVPLENDTAARFVLLGGEPFNEPLILWWNFVARTHEEIVAARDAWENGDGFARETGYDGAALTAPEISARLKAR